MKRKGFLKKIIGVLCAAGVLMSMPVTANAADKEDVLGDWTGEVPVSFYENGMAKDKWNERSYTIESGSLKVTYSSGDTETVFYDLWRGEQIKNIADDQYADAMVYRMIEPGKMQAWNVVKYAGSSDWTSYDPFILTKVEKAAAASKSSTKKDSASPVWKCEHYYEWRITTEPTETEDGVYSYICASCGDIKESQPVSANVVIRRNLLESIENAEAGTTVTFDNKAWNCYPQYVLDALREKGSISLKTDFTYEGKNHSFIIPAGSDYTNLERADFYGFMYLFGVFDGVIAE